MLQTQIADETKEGTQAIQASDVVTPLHAHANMSHSAGAASITYSATMENFQGLMQMCLVNKNPHAHYIKGIHEYFHEKHSAKGLEHLKQSIDGRCNYGTYIYGLFMISRVSMAEGKQYLSTIG